MLSGLLSFRLYYQPRTLEYRDCFLLFDKTGEDRIAYYEVGECLRAFGENPTNAEVQKVLNNPTQEGAAQTLM